MGQYIDLDEVAAEMGICRRTAETLLARGGLPAPVRIGRVRRWDRDMIAEWLRAQAQAAAEQCAPCGPGRPRTGGAR